MIGSINHILYHVLIVIFPFLLYYFITIRSKIFSETLHKGKLLGIMITILLLTMSFPVSYANGFTYDFRIIPIFITFIYIGLFQGMAITLVMFLYLQLFGEPQFINFIVNYSIITVVFYFFNKRLKRALLESRIGVISIIFWTMTASRGIYLLSNGESGHVFTMLFFAVITWVTLALVILIIENLIQQMMLQKELNRSEKLNLISQLAASVAHEVRNPMTTINGFLQLIRKDDNITEQQRSYIDISLGELSRAQEIINDYLSLARPNQKYTQLINLSEELHKVIDLMTSYTIIQNIEVVKEIEDDLFVKGNKDEIKQVMINLIKNGIEAMKARGKIEVSAHSEHGQIIIKIKDNGEGMTKEQLSRVGTPFYSTKDKGTGIGLTISYQIINQLKGKIDVTSELGEGTTFLITLPKYELDEVGNEIGLGGIKGAI